MLNGRELDFYFPDIHKAIEFNGDYWHCNPNLYDKDYFHEHKQLYAKDIWKLDTIKINNCNDIEIDLLIIQEQDWEHNNINCMDKIKDFIMQDKHLESE